MAGQAAVDLRLDLAALPLLPGAWDYASLGAVPGGTGRNRAAYAARVDGLDGIDPLWADLIFDPQTSGGLLLAAAPELHGRLLRALAEAGVAAATVGEAVAGSGRILLRLPGEG